MYKNKNLINNDNIFLKQKLTGKMLLNLPIDESEEVNAIYNEFAEPEDFIEKKLIEIWKQLLKVEKIGAIDDFFKLGGQSLTLISLISRCYKIFNVNLSIKEVYNNLTIRELAELIRNKEEEQYSQIEKAEKREYYEVS